MTLLGLFEVGVSPSGCSEEPAGRARSVNNADNSLGGKENKLSQRDPNKEF